MILGYRTEPQPALVIELNFTTAGNKPVAVLELGFKPEEKAAFWAVAQQIHTNKDRIPSGSIRIYAAGFSNWSEPRPITCGSRVSKASCPGNVRNNAYGHHRHTQ